MISRPSGSRPGAALDFFHYDTTKIFLLVTTIIFVVAIVFIGNLFNAIL